MDGKKEGLWLYLIDWRLGTSIWRWKEVNTPGKLAV